MAWTGKGVGDKEELKKIDSRFILKLIGLVEVWCSKYGKINDDLSLSVSFVPVGKFPYNMNFCLAIKMMIS